MKQSIYISLFLLLFASCKVRHQSATHRRERIRTEQTVLDSLSGRLLSEMSAKRKVRARLSVFAPPDSLGRQAIRAVLDVDMGEEAIRKDSLSLEETASLQEIVRSEAVTSRKTETDASPLSVWKIAGVVIFIVVIGLGVCVRKWKI
ncbi:MAG: hypothetical protein LBV32_02010 [Tannerellaceae bacterium]|jgi:hypothetical protein|nr:hypothetical protein [Tannerellaceae bacterium]